MTSTNMYNPPHKGFKIGSTIIYIDDNNIMEYWKCIAKTPEGYYVAQKNEFSYIVIISENNEDHFFQDISQIGNKRFMNSCAKMTKFPQIF